MEQSHPLATELGPAPCFGIEMVLPLAAHEDLPGLRNLEPFEVCFDGFHNTRS